MGPPGASGGGSGTGSAGAGNEGYTFVGFTVATYTGDLGGLQAAHAKCANEFATAHLCTSREYEQAGSAAPVPAAGAWIDAARYISTSSPSATPRDRDSTYTCSNWKASTAAYSGWLDAFGVYSTTTGSTGCGVARPLACCSS